MNIILSEKSWHKNFPKKLHNDLGGRWILIETREDFKYEKIKSINPDNIFIPHWSHIIPNEIFTNWNCILFHMTNLPFGRGGSPLQNLIVRGFTETKVSAIKVVKELDAGPIYLKEKLSLLGTADEIMIRAAEIIFKMIKTIITTKIEPLEQSGEIVHFKRRKPEDGNIFDLCSADKIYDYIRMLDSDEYPKAYLETKKFKYEFSNASINADKTIKANVRIIKKH